MFNLEVVFNRARRMEKDEQVSGILLVCVCARVCVRERMHKHTEPMPQYSSYEVTYNTHVILFFFSFTKGRKTPV